MDIFLAKVTQQAMNYAIRSGITITAGYAIRQSTRLLKTVEGTERQELQELQERLESKIRIISPAIDMIELISARGNTTLESAVTLTKSLRWDIQALGQRLAKAAEEENLARKGSVKARSKAQNDVEFRRIIIALKKLLAKIEDAVPLINLAITTSGCSLSTTLPATVSPSRLLQASTFLTAGDTQYAVLKSTSVQIGPTFTLSLYMLFAGHARPENEEDVRASTWKEAIHKARVKLFRVPLDAVNNLPDRKLGPEREGHNGQANGFDGPSSTPASAARGSMTGEVRSDEFAYQMVIVEDFDDDRMHAFESDEAQPGPYDDVEKAGIREALPIHQISKIFYADTGKILNIGSDGEANHPILLLKRDIQAVPPRRMVESLDEGQLQDEELDHTRDEATNVEDLSSHQLEINAQIEREHRSSSLVPIEDTSLDPADVWRIPPDLDPEWFAFEVYTETEDSDDESEGDFPDVQRPAQPRASSVDPQVTAALSHLTLDGSSTPRSDHSRQILPRSSPSLPTPVVRTSLSLLEILLRLLSLQQFQQTSHLSISDEFLNFFLSESATTGAAHGDEQERRQLRDEARRRVGFDPYDESPIKRRGEEYQYRGGNSQADWDQGQEREYYARSPSERIHRGYSSPIPDEVYSTRPISSGLAYRTPGPDTPPLKLQNRPYSSHSNSPIHSSQVLPLSGNSNITRQSSSPGRATAPGRQMGGIRKAKYDDAARRESPLK